MQGHLNYIKIRKAAGNMALAKAGMQWQLQPFVLLINFGAVREVKCSPLVVASRYDRFNRHPAAN
jgi:hypothetical protein